MREKEKWLIAFSLLFFVGGCVGVPPLNVGGPPGVAQIVDQVQCELLDAARKYKRLKSENWAAAVDLTLQVDDNIGLTPTLSFIRPLADAGTNFAFGASGTLKGARQRIYAESLDIPINAIRPRSCPLATETFDLTGTLGIVEAVDLGIGSVGSDDVAQFKKDKAFGQTIQFVVTKNVSGVGPTWTLEHFTGPGGLLGAERVDTHQLIISFAPGAATTKKGGNVGFAPAISRARDLNSQMLLKSLPVFRSVR
jgi:hypothetical protein